METDDKLHNQIMYSIGRLEGKVDRILASQTQYNEKVSVLENDMTQIKEWRSNLTGKIAVITTMLSLASGYIWRKIVG